METCQPLTTLLVSCLSMAGCSGVSISESPADDIDVPVERFIDFYFNEYARGLPGESDLADLASFVTPELVDLFAAALRGDECYAQKNNYDGPPAVEGDLFSSLFEGGTSATYRLIGQTTNAATFEIEWTNDSPIDPTPFVWRDRVFVVETAGGWLISDFAHLGTWEFMMSGSVSQILRAVAQECDG